MQAAIDRYFEDCKGEPIIGDDGFPICDKWGKPFIIHQRPPTVTGLALALGFTSRQALLDYQAKKGFVDTVTRARSLILRLTQKNGSSIETVSGARNSA